MLKTIRNYRCYLLKCQGLPANELNKPTVLFLQ